MPEEVFPWFAPDWSGPTVEQRPPDAGPEWPATATERVIFRENDFPELVAAIPDALPYVAYFDADGWPTLCPVEARPRLDPPMRAEFRRYPWTFRENRWKDPADWVRFGCSYDAYRHANSLVAMPRGIPEPIRSKRPQKGSTTPV
jgi:hypothetical protein